MALVTIFLITGSIGYADLILKREDPLNFSGGGNETSIVEGHELKEYKEIYINVENKRGFETCSGRFDLSNTDLYITVNGDQENKDGIHLTNWNPYIVLNKYVANIDAPKSDVLNLSHDATSAYATINYLDVTVKQGHGIRANAPTGEGNTHTITINNEAKITTTGNGSAGIYAGDSQRYVWIFGKETKGQGQIFLNGNTIIKNYGSNSYGIYAGKNGNITVNDLYIESFGQNSYGIVALDSNLIYNFFDNSKNKFGSSILLKGNNVTINLNSGKAIWADSEYGKITSENNKEILYDIKGDILASNNGSIDLNIASGSSINGNATSNKGNLTLNFSGEGSHIWKNTSENNTVVGIENTNDGRISLTGSNLTMEVNGKQLSGENAKQIGTNSTVTSFFDNVTQGIKIEGKENRFEIDGENKFLSSDIAITSKNANMSFKGKNYFEGNSYLIGGYEKDNLLVRPVIQSINGGNINLSGSTTIVSKTGEDGQDKAKINTINLTP